MPVIRPATLTDAATWPDVEPDRWREGSNRRSFVAEVDGQLVGHCRGIDNVHHPFSRVLVLEVRPEARGQGVGTALLRAQIAVSTRPLRVKITQNAAAAWSLARSFGGVVEQACPPWRRIVGPELRAWAQSHRKTDPTMIVRSITPEDLPALAALDADHYVAQHARWSPSASCEVLLELLADDFTAEGIDMSLTRVAIEDGRIVAAACVWPCEASEGQQSADPRPVEVSIIVDRHDDPARRPAMAACLAAVIDASKDGAVYGIDSHLTERVEYEFVRSVPSRDGTDSWMALVAIPVPGGPEPIPVPQELIPDEASWMRHP